MDIAHGTPESHQALLPLDASNSPGVAPPTTVSGQLTPADQGGVFDAAAMFSEQAAATTADCSAAMSAGMAAENDRRHGYAADILPLGAAYGDQPDLPDVPAYGPTVPPAAGYPDQGDEPITA